MRVIGLISGTSMDAIDAAVVDIERAGREVRVEMRAFVTMPYPAHTQAALESLLTAAVSGAPETSHFLSALASLNFAIGEAFGEAANLARNACADAMLIGSHGQTVCHQPRPDGRSALSSSTLQLGEAAVIAERTGLTTIADFRVADIAAGGEGAPLVSYIDYLLLRSPHESRVALNIGGIANVTLLPAGCSASQVQAFDTGPGNMPIDLATRMLFADGPGFDRNGQIAAQATIDENLLALLLADEYFSRRPPKSAGREQFGPDYVKRAWTAAQKIGCSREGFIATLTELTARTIVAAVPQDCSRLIAAGGGVHNKTLMGSLARNLSHRSVPPQIVATDAFGFPADAKEAIAFAVLAYETLHGRPGNMPHATAATHATVLGKIVPGANFQQLMRAVWSPPFEASGP